METENTTMLTMPERSVGSYDRAAFRGSFLHRKLRHLGLFMAKSKAACVFRDENARRLSADAAAYEREASDLLLASSLTAEGSNEDVCRLVFRLRQQRLGNGIFQREYLRGGEPLGVTALDQSRFCETLWRRGTVVFYLSEPRFAPNFRRDAAQAAKEGKAIFALAFPNDPALPDEKTLQELVGTDATCLPLPESFGCADLARVPEHDALRRAVESGDAFFCGYGEDALLNARRLRLPAEITVLPQGMPAQALTGLFTRPGVCRLYVPQGFDPIPDVPLVRPTRRSWFQLVPLAEQYGESVYFRTADECAALDPGLFCNLYDDHLPPRREPDFVLCGDLPSSQRAHLRKKLDALTGVRCLSGAFDPERFDTHPPVYDASEQQNLILTDGVLIAPQTKTVVYPGGSEAVSPRAFFFDRRGSGAAIVSNFSYFFTGKLADAYDRLRLDRPREQLGGAAGHVDFRRCADENGQRRESFPLYRKACLAAKKGGGYTAFRFALGGGCVTLNGLPLRWETPNDLSRDVTVFTPMLSARDEDADAHTYRLPVGAGRLNFVFIGDRLLTARQGDVLLPPVGVVLSVTGAAAKDALTLLGESDTDGYFGVDNIGVSIRLDPPDGFTEDEWDALEWIYGGGLGLIDGADEVTRENFLQWCRTEGWLSPLSRQTQESAQHTLKRHPRTGVGVTEKGELFVLVFSGRSPQSLGADYIEMVQIARRLVPDIRTFINWDGGGSSVLGLLEGDRFAEISLPSPSDESIMGMARPINTMIVVEP
ncbi:MAG: phosphodiester glycosidase family protein [Oscillospiraceae bacterium]|nr:phosphodiester glycosidase family protein [Oscillospiraceae bacterium]